MRPIFFITIISLFLLTACGTPAPQVTVTSEVTVTLTPTATFTASPTFTEIPIPTLAPTLTPDQQTALDAAKVAYADTGWEIQPSGEVIGAPEGVTYNVEKGVLEYTHESYGVTITEPLIINTEDSVKPRGVIVDLQGYGIDANHNLVPKSFSSAEGKNIEGGQRLHSKLEAQLFLANPDNVDMTIVVDNIFESNIDSPFQSGGSTSSILISFAKIVNEREGRYIWGDDRVPVSDGQGGFEMKKTTPFLVAELISTDGLVDKNVTVIYFWGKDHETDPNVPPKIMLVDSGDVVANANDPDHTMKNTYPEGWSQAYKDKAVKVRW